MIEAYTIEVFEGCTREEAKRYSNGGLIEPVIDPEERVTSLLVNSVLQFSTLDLVSACGTIFTFRNVFESIKLCPIYQLLYL